MPASKPAAPGEPRFFATAAAFRAWLARNAGSATELVVGFHKVGSGQPSMSWPESVDEALCVGWIDGVRKRIDEQRYQIRFTPRKPGSTWSAINIARVAALEAEGRMQAAGLAAFARRVEHKSRTYAYEQAESATLAPAEQKLFQADRAAWTFFERQPPSYRHKLLWWVTSAKQAATRQSRLQRLIEASKRGERI
ncbi:YdeI/OmpD-associated family protein [Rivibacter subsaxonicus]|uniref:Uncharacterized protein YdeI (YjbR/CyaY-like superfamily) n=1 Tax=Rivibacter subsaxonicus TaxID=457575 RepID=A0A4Q7W029_9BURK|nr:YdeI/OmpD-associated family protein [Rivibacter subsaxonicus]RZU02145.1 uncharacterized protein YdeI (YjbR/CyaY-like superfamily) [Rivibacter subsaxonicus]